MSVYVSLSSEKRITVKYSVQSCFPMQWHGICSSIQLSLTYEEKNADWGRPIFSNHTKHTVSLDFIEIEPIESM